jgi:glycosyltransferase involved in cell wall biosynthesis
LHDIGGSEEAAREELRRARRELARLADVERDVFFWRARAEAAEAVAAEWRTVQNRTLWKLFAALDRLRERIAPPRTRRERLALNAARGAARALEPLRRAPRRAQERFEPTGQKDVLFVYDDAGAWKLYRCDHQAEQLGYLGMSCDIVRSDQIDLATALHHYDSFVLNRVGLTESVASFVDAVLEAEKPVLFDTDDLLFEPELEPRFAFLGDASEGDHATWRQRLGRYQATLRACGAAVVSTEPLADHARRHAGRVAVVYNSVSSDMVRRADEALADRSHDGQTVVDREIIIGYLSGTPSHNRDFLEAADAVVWALETYPDTRFVVVGPLDLDARFAQFGSRVIRIPKQPFEELPSLVSKLDINLAPLERDDPLTECKSCVKYLEAGLVAVPTIASARPDFVRVIDSGRNGVLADDESEWHEALRGLIESPERRRTMGALACEDVRENHTTRATAPLLDDALRQERARSRAAVGLAHER